MPNRMRPSASLIVATVLVWIPVAALIAARVIWPDAPERVPTHWNGAGVADTFMTSVGNFWLSLLPPVGCGFIAVVVLVFVGSDVPPIFGALGFGVLAAASALISLQWPIDEITAHQATLDGGNRIGSAFLLYLLGVLWGLLVFGVAAIRRGSTSAREPQPA
jgi:hypothetical protein